MYCRGCAYVLDGIESNACPECGRRFDVSDRRTYDQTRHARLHRTANRILLITLGLLPVLYVLWPIVAPSGFGGTRICKVCGERQSFNERHWPLTESVMWTSQSSQSTPISQVINGQVQFAGHAHQWTFVSGGHYGGFGRSCALGEGHGLSQLFYNQDVAKVMGALAQVDQPAFDLWRQRLFDPDYSMIAASELSLHVQSMPLHSDAQFKSWWEKKQHEIEADYQFLSTR